MNPSRCHTVVEAASSVVYTHEMPFKLDQWSKGLSRYEFRVTLADHTWLIELGMQHIAYNKYNICVKLRLEEAETTKLASILLSILDINEDFDSDWGGAIERNQIVFKQQAFVQGMETPSRPFARHLNYYDAKVAITVTLYNEPIRSKSAPIIVEPDTLPGIVANLFTARAGTDCHIVSSSGTFHQAHKFVLALRSEYFKCLFSETDRSDLRDYSDEVIVEFLRYCYQDVVQNMHLHSVELIYLANFTLVEGLKLKCAEHIADNLTVSNVIQGLEFGMQMNHGKLRSKASQYFAEHAEEIMSSPHIQDMFRSLPESLRAMFIQLISSNKDLRDRLDHTKVLINLHMKPHMKRPMFNLDYL